ncbi:MAG: aminoacyl-tRNA deacylase [Desulfurococcaceae archaeon]
MTPARTWREVVEGIEVEVLEFEGTVESVEKASRLSGEPPSRIAKTLLLKTEGGYVVAVVRGDRRVSFEKAAQVLGGPARLARPEEVKRVLGSEPGAVTPLSSSVKRLRVLLDPALLENEYVLCGGGSLNRLFKVRVRDLVEYLKPEVADAFE